MLNQNLFIGTAGWSYKDWEGRFYPDKLPGGSDKLSFYADYFDVVEINSSFYNIPPHTYASGWIKKVKANPRFRFTVKLWKGFTHETEYPGADILQRMKDLLKSLKDTKKLGGVLIQFPWSFRDNLENRDKLGKILYDFHEFNPIVEVRHGTWNNDDYLKLLTDKSGSFCNIDQPIIGNSLEPSSHVTSDIAYFRFHGRNYENWFKETGNPADRYNYLYTQSDLEPWVERIRSILERKIDTYVITNNHWHGKAAHTALSMKEKLTGEKTKIPDPLVHTYPELKRISTGDNPSQQRLFND